MELRISTHDTGETLVVALDGLADLASVPQLQSRLAREVATGRPVVVDVDGLLALDDVALGLLLGAAATARARGGELAVLTTSARWRERFRATGFDRAVEVRSSADTTR